jgi:hypothetical protein
MSSHTCYPCPQSVQQTGEGKTRRPPLFAFAASITEKPPPTFERHRSATKERGTRAQPKSTGCRACPERSRRRSPPAKGSVKPGFHSFPACQPLSSGHATIPTMSYPLSPTHSPSAPLSRYALTILRPAAFPPVRSSRSPNPFLHNLRPTDAEVQEMPFIPLTLRRKKSEDGHAVK